MKQIQKISKVTAGVFAGLSLTLVILMAALWIKGRMRPDETPSVFGLVPLIVHTDSMAPVFESGDLIIGVRTDARDVRKGDIISFRDPASPSGAIVTHRVSEVLQGADETRAFRTKGDANGTADVELVPESALAAVYKGTRLQGLGRVLSFLRSGPGLFICFAAPLILFLLPEAIFESLEKRKENPSGMAAAGGEKRR
jgi:signal peptidase